MDHLDATLMAIEYRPHAYHRIEVWDLAGSTERMIRCADCGIQWGINPRDVDLLYDTLAKLPPVGVD